MALMLGERQASSGLAPVTAVQEVRLMEHQCMIPAGASACRCEGLMGVGALHHIIEQVLVETAPSELTS